MSHTNSTTNYNLPQFIGTDKPTWLNDVNGAMSTIDTQMKANADSATSAGTSATTANNAIGTLSNLETTVKTDLVSAVNEVNTTVGTVSGVASEASSVATQAKNTADGLASYFDLKNFDNVTSNIVLTGATVNPDDTRINCASNDAGTLGKIYGQIRFSVTSTSGCTITIPTAFRPDETLTIDGVAQIHYENVHSFLTMNVATNGNVTFHLSGGWYNRSCILSLTAVLLFLKNFGDSPVTPNA